MSDKTRLTWVNGSVIKQGDTSSIFKLKLKTDDNAVLNGPAKIQLVQGQAKIEYDAEVVDNQVTFNLPNTLPVGSYIVEVEHAGYVFPSTNSVVLTVNENLGDVITDEIAELLTVDDYIKQKLADFQTGQIDLDELASKLTIPQYDDGPLTTQISDILAEISVLKQSQEQSVQYDDSELRSQISALSERLENIQLTPGPQGLPDNDGQDGKSAYQIAVDNGFVGGEQEWLDSLKVPSESQAVVKVLRHAPTGYAISEPLSDDAGEYYQVYFDNGCILELRKSLKIPVQETGGVLGIGQAAALEASTTTLAAAPLTYAIIRTACRSVQLNTWKTSNGVAQWYRDGYIVLNPVNDVAIYDWSNAKYNPADTLTVSLDNQQYLIRTFYALGIWGDATVESFGAVRL
ncbi:hypothetical protein AB1F57_05305 [Streptococcus sp. ZY1909104]|uniref:hypothetical protein n=1 Tax=Streptococcus sp. ZY1909104 TaxID=3233335 RepID=UPI00349FAB9B